MRSLGLLGVGLLAALAQPAAALATECGAARPPAQVVVGLVDAGVNPYNIAFRDTSPLAYQYPGTYIPGYPKNVPALNLTFDAPSFADAFKKDAELWASVKPNKLYWFPGTRIIGGMSMGSGGTNCPYVGIPPANILQQGCADTLIYDDHGHGTMTASRAAGSQHSLAPTARIVEVEGLGAGSLRWVADQGWIDVSSNSWVSLVPPEVGNQGFDDTGAAFYHAANRMAITAASGNGAAYSQGFAPTPTYLLSTAAPGVTLVGGHDNGDLTLWAGTPVQVVADAYGGWAAINTSLTDVKPAPVACCTSAAAPYVAGAMAAIILKARQLLGDHGTGYTGPVGDPTKRIVASGSLAAGCAGDCGAAAAGILGKGYLTLQDVRDILYDTALARPVLGRDDGLLSPLAAGSVNDAIPYGPGGNPFCQGCVTVPLQWTAIPSGAPAYPLIGYGDINETSIDAAYRVLEGRLKLPSRAAEDQFMAQDRALREQIFPNTDDTKAPPYVPPTACVSAAATLPTPAAQAPIPLPNTAAGPLTLFPIILAALVGGLGWWRRRRLPA